MANLLNADSLSKISLLSKRQVFRLNAMGKIPRPLKINGAVRWDSADIDLWISLGCPARAEFESKKGELK